MTVLTPPGYLQGGTYTAKLDRIYLATIGNLPDLSASFSARQGFFNGRVPVYANPSGMDVTIGACSAIIKNTFASASGDYFMANDATVQVTPAASSPTQNRHDIIGFQVKDNLFDSSGLNTVVPAVIQGSNSAGTPSDPSLPASFIPVLRAVVNAGVTSPTLQSLIRKTTSDGGLLRVANPTERAEISPYDGQAIYREDRDWIEVRDGSAWRVQGVAHCSSVADMNSAITDPYSGQLAVTTDSRTLWVRNGGSWLMLNGGVTVARHTRETSSSTTTSSTGIGVILGSLPMLAGHRYRVGLPVCHITSTTNGDITMAKITHTTDGSEPTPSSPILKGAQSFGGAHPSPPVPVVGYITPVSDITFRYLVCVARFSGSGQSSIHSDGTRVTDVEAVDTTSIDPGNSGTNV